MALRELAEADLSYTIEDEDGIGTRYTLVSFDGTEFSVVGTAGDISMLFDPETGETVSGRSIVTTCRMRNLEAIPVRGWQVRLKDVLGNEHRLFVQDVRPDRSLGVWRFTMGVDLEGLENA